MRIEGSNGISTINNVAPNSMVNKNRGEGNLIKEDRRQETEIRPIGGHGDKSETNSVSEEVVIKAIEKANKALQGVDRYFEFSIHEQTKQIVVKIKNKENDEVIREIPNEKILDMVAKMWELAGIIVDKKL